MPNVVNLHLGSLIYTNYLQPDFQTCSFFGGYLTIIFVNPSKQREIVPLVLLQFHRFKRPMLSKII